MNSLNEGASGFGEDIGRAPNPVDLRHEQGSVRAHLDLVLNTLTDHAILTLDTNGYITSWNTGAEKTKGYTEKEILGQHFSIFYSKEERDRRLPDMALRNASEFGIFETEGWRIRKGGEPFWASLTVHPLRDKEGRLHGYVKVTRDISEKRRVASLQNELFQSQKLEMVGQLAGGVAHDFNNLLTAISGTFQLLSQEAKTEKMRRILEVNRFAMERSQRLVAQLLAFSRKQTLNPVSVDVNQVVSVFSLLLERTLGELIELHWELRMGMRPIQADAGYLQSSIMNLVLNAKDAMPRGGMITIFSEEARIVGGHAKKLEIPPGDYVVVGVRDTGIGMTPEIMEMAIEPFFTTKDVGKGTGLGLSQCYGYARQSGGAMSIESKIGNGTTVSLYFPVSEAAATDIKSQARSILLVEDETNVRVVTAEVLRTLGHIVIEAGDADEALSKLNSGVPIDFLFTDIILPNGLNGVQLAEKAGMLQPEIKTILASAHPRDALKQSVKLTDNVVFLKKPYNAQDLIDNFGGSVPEQADADD